ncbi:MAG: hypothetical protein MRZ79_16255 [Bacteroidia bacterium]|nr:hypothetical protein [Bacteroidia bacterium]
MKIKFQFTRLLALLTSLFFLHMNCHGNVARDSLKRTWPIRIQLGNQDVGFGSENTFSSFNPRLSVGTTYLYNKNLKHQLGQHLNMDFTNNRVLGNKLSLQSHFFYRYLHKSGIYGELGIGLGLMRQFYARPIYEKEATGSGYQAAKSSGVNSLNFGYEISLGYTFQNESRIPIQAIFLSSALRIQYPYFNTAAFPIIPLSLTQIGVQLKLNQQ